MERLTKAKKTKVKSRKSLLTEPDTTFVAGGSVGANEMVTSGLNHNNRRGSTQTRPQDEGDDAAAGGDDGGDGGGDGGGDD